LTTKKKKKKKKKTWARDERKGKHSRPTSKEAGGERGARKSVVYGRRGRDREARKKGIERLLKKGRKK